MTGDLYLVLHLFSLADTAQRQIPYCQQCVVPIGSYHEKFNVTLSLPACVDRQGMTSVLVPALSADELHGLEKRVETLRDALNRIS